MPSINVVETKNELDRLVANIPTEEDSVLMNNVKTKMKLGTRVIETPFTSVFSAGDSLILLKEGKLSKEEFEKALEDKEKLNVLYFLPLEEEEKGENIDFSIVTTTEGLRRELISRLDNHDDICTYYPKLKGSMDIYHLLENGEKIKLDRAKLQGVLEFRDKLLVFTKPVPYKDLFLMLWEEEIYTELDLADDLPFHEYEIPSQK